MLKKVSLFLVMMLLSLAVTITPAIAAGTPVEVNGKVLSLDVDPVIVEGRTLVPFRAIFEALGGNVAWNESSKTVTGKKGSISIELTMDSKTAKVSGSSITLDVPARIMNGRTLVPLRFVSENLGANVAYDYNTKAVRVTEMAGTIQIAGSTSVQPLSEELAKTFMAIYPNVKLNIAGGGSGAGIKAAQQGIGDIGASSRELKPEETGIKEFTIALDGIAIIVNKDNPVSDLTKEEIMKIFSGEISNWSALGGGSNAIRVISREEGSGTRGAFEELILGKAKLTDKALFQNSTGAVRTAVAADKYAIGYISLGSLNEDVKALKVDGKEATVGNVKWKEYKIYRPFLYLTKTDPQGITRVYIDWVLSAEGQKIVGQHYISVD